VKFTIYILMAMGAIGVLAWRICFPKSAGLSAPALANAWDECMYGLDDEEVLRFIAPPFPPMRAAHFRNWRQTLIGNGQLVYGVNGNADGSAWHGMSNHAGDLESAISWCTGLRDPDLDVAEGLNRLPADGDWMIRSAVPIERKMTALRSMLSAITRRELVIDKRSVEREVVVVQGQWALNSATDNDPAQFYTLRRGRHVGEGPIAESLKELEMMLNQKVIDEVQEPRPQHVLWNEMSLGMSPNDTRDDLLRRLEKQTSLKFVRMRRVVPVWAVHDQEGRQ